MCSNVPNPADQLKDKEIIETISLQVISLSKWLFFILRRKKYMTTYKDETLCIHGGYKAEKGKAQTLPICESTTFRYFDPDELADIFDLNKEGYIYSRIDNPSVKAFEEKINTLEGGVGAVGFASGQAALTAAVLTLCDQGDHILASSKIYGGSITLLTTTLKRFGIAVTLVDTDLPLEALQNKIQQNTKIIFGETIGNPGLNVLDFEKLSQLAQDNAIVFMVDNTFATPYLFKPFDHGANIVTHSATKYIDGHGVALAGVVVDGGNFDWKKSDRYNRLTSPDEAYHGIVFTEKFEEAAYITKVRVNLLRDLGAALSPHNAVLLHRGLETLHLRMQRHSENALRIAQFLEKHPAVEWVKYPLIASHETYALGKKYLSNGGSGVLSFGIEGGIAEAQQFIESVDLISLVTHVGDLRTSVLHPATTTHRQLSKEALEASGVTQNMIRLSVGLENCEDIIADLKHALGDD